MHAVFMTFEFSGGGSELTKTLNGFADSLNEASGLVINNWMRDGSTIGGFHVFHSLQSAESFLKSGRMRALTANLRVSEVYVQIFSMLTNAGASLPEPAMVMQTADGMTGEHIHLWRSEIDPVTTPTG